MTEPSCKAKTDFRQREIEKFPDNEFFDRLKIFFSIRMNAKVY